MADIIDMRGRRGAIDFASAIQEALREHPRAKSGIVIVFDEEDAIHTRYYCNRQEASMASVRLAHIAAREDF